MVAGIPGTGIGGIFYLLSVFVMPVNELIKTISGKSSRKRWRFVRSQVGLGLGIVGGFWATGLILGIFINQLAISLQPKLKGSHLAIHNILQMHPLEISLLTLFFVLINVQVLEVLLKFKRFAARD